MGVSDESAGRVAIVTGASSGFGEACARRFVAEGWRVALVARRADRLQRIASELGGGALPVVLDVRDREAVFDELGSLTESLGPVDLLVNNAGLALGLEPAPKASLEDWERMIDTNVKGLVYCAQALLPGMVERNHGHIVQIGSVAGTWPYPGGNVYGATKAFVRQFGNNLRSDLVGTKVRVTTIEPGLAETEFSIVRHHGDEKRARETYRGTEPLRGEDVAEIVHWVTNVPPHVNVNRVEVMPVCQAWGGFAIARDQRR